MLALAASMFALGLVTSVHCVSMCGPLILTYAVKGRAQAPWYRRLAPNVAYHAARFASYAAVGLLLGAAGSAFDFDVVRPYALFFAGGLMIVLGIGMTGRVRWARYLAPRPPRILVDTIGKMRRRARADAEVGDESLTTAVIFGLLTGLLPCGPAIAAELAAATSGSAAAGALGMLAFGAGTAPLLFVFGTSASLIPLRFKAKLNLVLAAAVMLWGAFFFDQALTLVGSPITLDAARTAVLGRPSAAPSSTPAWTTEPDGVIEVRVACKSTKFIPATVDVPTGSPFRLVIDRVADDTCDNAKQIEIPELHMSVSAAAHASTPVEMPAIEKGSYALTCAMGLMHGSLEAVESRTD